MSKKTLMIVGSAVILLLTLILIPSKKDESGQKQSQPATSGTQPAPAPVMQAEPREGSVEITTTPDDQWITAPSKSCFESNKWLSGTIVTPGIFWQVMLDNDTNKVRSLYPKDWKTNSVRLETNTFNVHSWRVDPRYHPYGTKAVVRWRITDQPPN